ncbi:MAG TPA: helix-turn-helix domain-containing protein, partial [Reyranella sp.]|nr:helix-turn-helix domain-containing protein [Reyranella sp.]
MGAIRDAARTRKRIVQAARQEFAQRGFAGARIDAIAKRAKIKKQLLYHYYASKAALFDEIVQQAIELREDLAMADEAPGAIFRQRFLT